VKSYNNEQDNFLGTYEIHFEQLKNKNLDNCPAVEKLTSFLNQELPDKENKQIEEHLNFCPLCLAAYERLAHADRDDQNMITATEEWEALEARIDHDVYGYLKTAIRRKKRVSFVRTNWIEILIFKLKNLVNFLMKPNRVIYAGAVVVVVIFSLYGFAYLSRPGYFELARIENERTSVLRSISTPANDFSSGLKFFQDKKYEQTILALEIYLKENPDHYEANYYIGLAYLLEARKGIPGLSYKFDQANVDKGLKYLDRALQVSQENQFYQEDCYWYLGKALLMKGELEKAKVQFEKIIDLNQLSLMRKEQGREMILQIERIKVD
jgi:tetratricopeptide (TPR) repeat protein